MLGKSDWFTVDAEGLAKRQEGKPRYYAVRELVQNALDATKTLIDIETYKEGRGVCFVVTDDGEGYENLEDAWKIFGITSKHSDPEKSGLFDFGNKQALAVSSNGAVITTCGMVTFDKKRGRVVSKRTKRVVGTQALIRIPNMTKAEMEETIAYLKTFIFPEHIEVTLNGERIGDQMWMRRERHFKASLQTQYAKEDGVIRSTKRKTMVELFNSRGGQSRLYELGIPVMDIDLPFHVNVHQRVPLNTDRDMVAQSFLKELYAHVLNAAHGLLKEDEVSSAWVHQAVEKKDLISREAVEDVFTQRYGTNFCSHAPFDATANDDALAEGYRVVRGGELSGDEWDVVKSLGIMQSASAYFGHGTATDMERVEPSSGMKMYARLAKAIAHEFLHIDVEVRFFTSKQWSHAAEYGDRMMNVNVTMLGKDYFSKLGEDWLRLIVHELSHEKGNHTEAVYHKTICEMAGWLTMRALYMPRWFEKVMGEGAMQNE